MNRAKSRRVPRSGVVVALVGGVLALQLGQAGPDERPRTADAAVVSADGDLDLRNSADGNPILSASDLAPGDTLSGEVTVTNMGAGSGVFSLTRRGLSDNLGVGGGVLSDRLELVVTDVTAPATPTTVYSGPLGSMPMRSLGTLAPGEERTYRFEATFPERGASDDAYVGAAASVAYRWTVSSDLGGPVDPPVDPPAGGGSGGPGPTVPGGSVPGPVFVQPGLRMGVTFRKRQALRRGTVRIGVRCSQSCRFISRAGIRVKGARKPLGKSRSVRLRGQPGRLVTVKLRVSERTVSRVRTALAMRKRVLVQVRIRARNASGSGAVTLKAARVVRVSGGRVR